MIFLRISVYYGLKLLRLTDVFYSYSLVEKNYLGIIRVIWMTLIMVRVINLYVRLILRLTLEVFSFKIVIYLFIMVFIVLRVLRKFRLKLKVYDKIKNFYEG